MFPIMKKTPAQHHPEGGSQFLYPFHDYNHADDRGLLDKMLGKHLKWREYDAPFPPRDFNDA